MPQQPQYITMERDGVTKQVDPKLYKVAIQKGWKRSGISPVPKSLSPTPTEAPKQQAMGGLPGASTGGSSPFVQGFTSGVNPFHGAPAGTPSTGSTARDIGEDVLNLREMGQLGKEGKKAEGFGLMAGTVASLAGPEALKLGGAALKGGRGVEEMATKLPVAAKRQAAEQAVGLVKKLRGNIKDARLAETLVQPIRQTLDHMYEPLHKALEGEIVPLSNAAQKLLKRIEATEPEAAKEVAQLLNRSALDYREAIKYESELKRIAHESPQLRSLGKEIEKAVDTVAQKKGLLSKRMELKGWTKQMHDVEAAAFTSVTRSALRSLVRKVPNVGRFIPEGGGKVGEVELKAANKLMGEITGKAKSEVIRKIGEITESSSKAYQRLTPMYRAIHAAFQDFGNNSDSSTAQLKSVQ